MTNRLLFLNGLAILMIPIHHATAYGLQAMLVWGNAAQGGAAMPEETFFGLIPYYLTMVLRQLDTFAVPAFLFISGYFVAFMARGKETKVSYKMVLPRIRILLPPFVIWTVIRYALLRSFPGSVDELLDPYHFIPLLIQFYLLAPFLVPLARKRPLLLLGTAAAIHLGVQTLRYLNNLGVEMAGLDMLLTLTPRWFIIGQQPFWFPFGLVFGLHGQRFTPWLVRTKWKLFAGALLFGVLAIGEYLVADYSTGNWGVNGVGPTFAGFSRNFYILFFILAVISFDVPANGFNKFIQRIGSQSLGIYMANIPSIYIIAVLMYHLTPWVLGIQLFYQPVLFIVGLAIPLALMWIVRQLDSLRPTYRYLFG